MMFKLQSIVDLVENSKQNLQENRKGTTPKGM